LSSSLYHRTLSKLKYVILLTIADLKHYREGFALFKELGLCPKPQGFIRHEESSE